jgi:alanine dehydrogenase
MALLINNQIAEQALNMRGAIDAMESALRQYAEGYATFQPRTDLWSPAATVGDYYRWGSVLGALSDPPILAFRLKSDILVWKEYSGAVTEEWFNVKPGKYCGLIFLIDMRTGELISIMNDGYIQSFRVGATAGVSTKYLARESSKVLGLLGSGAMARTYATAICEQRRIETIKVFSPTPKNRDAYANDMGGKLNVNVVPVNSPEEAMENVDIGATCTDSRIFIFRAEWLKPNMHVVNVRPDEMDDATYNKADLVVRTSNDAMLEYVLGSEEDRKRRPMGSAYRRRYTETNQTTLSEVIVGAKPGRTSDDQMTFHHNLPVGIQFPAVGYLVYRYAKENGLGRELPLEWFQQDIRN